MTQNLQSSSSWINPLKPNIVILTFHTMIYLKKIMEIKLPAMIWRLGCGGSSSGSRSGGIEEIRMFCPIPGHFQRILSPKVLLKIWNYLFHQFLLSSLIGRSDPVLPEVFEHKSRKITTKSTEKKLLLLWAFLGIPKRFRAIYFVPLEINIWLKNYNIIMIENIKKIPQKSPLKLQFLLEFQIVIPIWNFKTPWFGIFHQIWQHWVQQFSCFFPVVCFCLLSRWVDLAAQLGL